MCGGLRGSGERGPIEDIKIEMVFRAGDIAVVVTASSFSSDSGYLETSVGDGIVVLHVEDAEWCYARLVSESDEFSEGWISIATLRPHNLCADIGGKVSVTLSIKFTSFGYLVATIGSTLEILHVSSQDEERGWLYCCLVEDPHKQGWYPVHAVTATDDLTLLQRPKRVCPRADPKQHGRRNVNCFYDRRCSSAPDKQAGLVSLSESRTNEISKPFETCGTDHPSPIANIADPEGLRLLGSGLKHLWQYPLQDCARRCFVGYLPGAIQDSAAKKYLKEIMESMDDLGWDRPSGGFGQFSRFTKWMVRKGCNCPYHYGGTNVYPSDFPSWMDRLLAECMPLCGIFERSAWPNSCNLNRYADGSDGLDWHADDEDLFQGRETDCCIISLSFGSERAFEVRLADEAQGTTFRRLNLGNGDMCTMEGLVQQHYVHRIPKASKNTRVRVNLTWRWIKKHDAHWCGL